MQKERLELALNKINDSNIKDKFITELIDLNKKEAFTNYSKYHGFDLIDISKADKTEQVNIGNLKFMQSFNYGVQSEANKLDMKYRAFMFFVSIIMISLLLSISFAFLIEYLKKIKIEHPEKYKKMIQYLKLK